MEYEDEPSSISEDESSSRSARAGMFGARKHVSQQMDFLRGYEWIL